MSENLPAETQAVTAEISVTDESDARSIVNLVGPSMAQAIADLTFEHPEYFNIDEYELSLMLKAQGKNLTPLDHRLRLQFWNEYHRTQARNEKFMSMSNVYLGLCAKETFYTKYLKNSAKLGWLLCPPTGYLVKAAESLEFAIDQIREILDLPNTLNGKPDSKLIGIKARLFETLHNIVKGAPVQRNLNVNVSNAAVANLTAATTTEDLEKQLKELERRDRKARNLPDIEVASVDKPAPDTA